MADRPGLVPSLMASCPAGAPCKDKVACSNIVAMTGNVLLQRPGRGDVDNHQPNRGPSWVSLQLTNMQRWSRPTHSPCMSVPVSQLEVGCKEQNWKRRVGDDLLQPRSSCKGKESVIKRGGFTDNRTIEQSKRRRRSWNAHQASVTRNLGQLDLR